MVDPVQEDTKEHGKEDGEVKVEVEPPRPLGRACVKHKEVDPAAEDQEDVLDTVEEKQGTFFSRIVVEMRVFGAFSERGDEPDVGHCMDASGPKMASSERWDRVVGALIDYEQMNYGQNTQCQGNFTNMDRNLAQFSLKGGVEKVPNVVKYQKLTEVCRQNWL